MGNSMELQQVVYSVIKTQIQFGAYRFEERLPTIEDSARLFMVSVRTIRAAYQHLQRDGLITISKSIGVKVKVQYSSQDIETSIQSFFAQHKEALIDLGRSMQLLFSNAQWIGFKNASPELLDQIEQVTAPRESIASYIMIRQFQAIYGALGNDLLMRLVWQIFMFFLTPFLSVPGNLVLLDQNQNSMPHMIALCREQNWQALRACVDAFQEQKGSAFRHFYKNRVQLPDSDQQAVFRWSAYKKASQIYYSLSLEILISIYQGVYPPGSFLPSLNTLAKEKHISVNTARRTMALLNDIGAAKSINGLGTKVLPLEQITENCDLSQISVQKRLLNHAKSVHILALSCRQVAEATISSLDQKTKNKWKAKLSAYAQVQRYELASYAIVNLISQDAPYMAIRTVYTELVRILFWGYSLRGLLKDTQKYNDFYVSCVHCFLDCLEKSDAAGFSSKLEELMQYEIVLIVERLVGLGIEEAAALKI